MACHQLSPRLLQLRLWEAIMSHAMENLFGRTLEPMFCLVGSLREAHGFAANANHANDENSLKWSRASRRQAIAEAAKELRRA
jgi:hypothetical protein